MMKQFEVNTDDPPSIADRLVSVVRDIIGSNDSRVVPVYSQTMGCLCGNPWDANYLPEFLYFRDNVDSEESIV